MRDLRDSGLPAIMELPAGPQNDLWKKEPATLFEKPSGSVYELKIPARIEAVGPLCAFLNTIGECHGLMDSELQSLEISAYETCLNIIEHAYGFDSSARIMIRIHLGPKRACLAFLDNGTGINPSLIPPPDLGDPNVRRRGRGFGLQIIRKSVNRMRYRRMPSGENQFFLMKELAGQNHEGLDAIAHCGGDMV